MASVAEWRCQRKADPGNAKRHRQTLSNLRTYRKRFKKTKSGTQKPVGQHQKVWICVTGVP